AINTWYHPHARRAEGARLAPAERLRGVAEVQLGLGAELALAEAERCFSCGHCTGCDNCYYFCPDMAIRRVARGYAVAEDYCKGCGLCAYECPTGSIVMREESK
ncbi:MAG: 4Fe-4S binding protein, partial [Pseudomonadota bacterium]